MYIFNKNRKDRLAWKKKKDLQDLWSLFKQ